jgi:hypothetical protein
MMEHVQNYQNLKNYPMIEQLKKPAPKLELTFELTFEIRLKLEP